MCIRIIPHIAGFQCWGQESLIKDIRGGVHSAHCTPCRLFEIFCFLDSGVMQTTESDYLVWYTQRSMTQWWDAHQGVWLTLWFTRWSLTPWWDAQCTPQSFLQIRISWQNLNWIYPTLGWVHIMKKEVENLVAYSLSGVLLRGHRRHVEPLTNVTIKMCLS